MKVEKLEFTGHTGEKLAARLDRPDGEVRAVALFAHCFTCTKDLAAARRIAARLSALGFAVLRFDFTGLGHSEGEFANTNFSSNVEDLVLAARELEEIDLAPDLLIGHSLGGAAVLKAAAEIASARAVVTIAAPASPAHVLSHIGADLDTIREKGEAEVELGGRPFVLTKQFIEDIEESGLAQSIAELDRALLVLHGPRDRIVGIENASKIFLAAKHPKSFITLDDADHLISKAEDAEYVAEVIGAWSQRYLKLPTLKPTADAPEGVVRVSEADPKGFRQDIVVDGRYQLAADEPADFGGTEAGPSPYQFLSTGLGACTAMTIRMYARRKEWPLSHVSVDISHDKRHAEDCAECETQDGKVDVFRRSVRLEGDLSDEQRQRLLEIADKCPVHKTLHSSSVIETELADEE
ncbi:bifunctional alpha/beta hydrolase/OsmC family protein [Fodinicurvata fenggangensis]|uniref:bifunctional alpha/beta hydrolase/OsmC family protein n=1 Tax=Fodinicurvata fenggangensis TaxID=1121830 RepID=UPI00047E982B|nr:bifunctional alpha/beta hydrolase/OsmC family protein [Fodinicurvata fenggangensis]